MTKDHPERAKGIDRAHEALLALTAVRDLIANDLPPKSEPARMLGGVEAESFVTLLTLLHEHLEDGLEAAQEQLTDFHMAMRPADRRPKCYQGRADEIAAEFRANYGRRQAAASE
jgi:hypothetical protein